MKKRKFLRDAALYSSSLFFTRFLLSIRGILIPKLLGPAEYGLYNSLLLIPEYVLHVHFGTLDALKREIPFCYGRKDLARASLIRNTAFFQYVFTTSCSVVIILLITFFFRNRLGPSVFYALGLICVWIFFLSFETFFDQVARTDNRFDILTRTEIFASLTGFIFMLLMILTWGLYGLLGSLILVSMLKAGYIFRGGHYRIAWQWDFQELKRLLKIGFPMVSGVILATVLNSVDRFIIIVYLESMELGYYALALTVLSFLLIIMTGTYGVLEPRIYRLYGEKGSIEAIRPLMLEALSGMTLIFPLILGLIYIVFPLLVTFLLPKYLPSLTCIRIMILGSFFFIFQRGTYNFIIAVNRQAFIVKVEGILIGISYLSGYLLIKQGWGIEGVALATMGSNALGGLIFLVFTLSVLFNRPGEWLIYSRRLFSPFLLVVPLLILMDHFWILGGDWRNDLVKVSLKGGGLLLLMSPFLWRLKEKIKNLQHLGFTEDHTEPT
ncbi:MAG: oligosaccharide flippase family protein, partial [Deltaproteobacteria bacterium]|nr:oligosaccharide flippase family protein [Deltaproteobacteria bacterium]